MKEIIDLLIDLIETRIFAGFAIYTIIYLVFINFKRSKAIFSKLDENAIRFIIFVGLFLVVLWLAKVIFMFSGGGEEKRQIIVSLIGAGWKGFWLQTTIYLLITQLLRIIFVKKSFIFRFLFSIFYLISISSYVTIVTSINRYPKSVNLFSVESILDTSQIMIINLFIFGLLSLGYFFAIKIFTKKPITK